MKNFEQHASEVASKFTYSGAGAGIFGAFAQIDWAMWVGIITAILSLFINLYFKREDAKIKREEAQLNKRKIEAEIANLHSQSQHRDRTGKCHECE